MQSTCVHNFKNECNAINGEKERKINYHITVCLAIGKYLCRTLPEDKKEKENGPAVSSAIQFPKTQVTMLIS